MSHANPRSVHRGSTRFEPALLLALVVLAVAVSAVQPRNFGTWLLEIVPVVIGLAILVPTYRRFPLTALAYRALAVGALFIALGAHYTYAEVPVGYWLQDWFGFTRNHYDRIGHFVQGFVSAIVVRELLIRLTPLRSTWWLFGIVTLAGMGISGGFEILEAIGSIITGQSGDAYLATQGDPLDAQWDMALALVGILISQTVLARIHNRQLGLAPARTSNGPRCGAAAHR